MNDLKAMANRKRNRTFRHYAASTAHLLQSHHDDDITDVKATT